VVSSSGAQPSREKFEKGLATRLNEHRTNGTVLRGDCASDKDNGIFVNGKVNIQSGAVLSQNGGISFTYADANGDNQTYVGEAPNPGLPASDNSLSLFVQPPTNNFLNTLSQGSAIGPDPNWGHSRQAQCTVEGIKAGGEDLIPFKGVIDSFADFAFGKPNASAGVLVIVGQ
jgi:hypothetical protein